MEDTQEETQDIDIEQDFYILQNTVNAILELLIDKKIISEAEFEKKYDELCETEE